ncbi:MULTISPECIES: alpha/beta fold hydrolase [unclassified Paraburkholderia]|uniref:alpha/beta fold hydrolase n=1 Tax=unclassified Paraburkholderia TaxID=2615204 RepID=UPI002AB0FCA2|nr:MULTISPECIES: alpha/beta fold hydrolase [unclassified Paraburkholderia]
MSDSRFAELAAQGARGACTIEYRWVGVTQAHAPLAVFLHEGLGSVAMWKDWPHALCERLGLRGLVYSRPGYGRSTPRAHAQRWPVDFMARQAHDVLPALLDAIGIGAHERTQMWLIGHSDGASIALLYAARFADALAGAVVIAPHVFVEDISVEGIRAAKNAFETDGLRAGLRARLARYHDDVESAFYGWNDIWLDPAFRAWNIVGEIASIRAPLLAVQARDDQYGTLAQIEAIGTQVPHARVLTLEAGGHSPHRDAREALDDAIAALMHEHDARPQR